MTPHSCDLSCVRRPRRALDGTLAPPAPSVGLLALALATALHALLAAAGQRRQSQAPAVPQHVKKASPGNDKLKGTPNSDVIDAKAGNDTVSAYGGNDVSSVRSATTSISGVP